MQTSGRCFSPFFRDYGRTMTATVAPRLSPGKQNKIEKESRKITRRGIVSREREKRKRVRGPVIIAGACGIPQKSDLILIFLPISRQSPILLFFFSFLIRVCTQARARNLCYVRISSLRKSARHVPLKKLMRKQKQEERTRKGEEERMRDRERKVDINFNEEF